MNRPLCRALALTPPGGRPRLRFFRLTRSGWTNGPLTPRPAGCSRPWPSRASSSESSLNRWVPTADQGPLSFQVYQKALDDSTRWVAVRWLLLTAATLAYGTRIYWLQVESGALRRAVEWNHLVLFMILGTKALKCLKTRLHFIFSHCPYSCYFHNCLSYFFSRGGTS